MNLDLARQLLLDGVGSIYPSAQLVVCEGGKTVLDEAVGECDADTLFDVASLTKALVTTTLAMRLVESSRLGLGDELRPGVTVRHALAHATGLPAWRPLYDLVDADTEDRRAAMIAAALHEPLEAPPGTRSVYSDLGFILLGDAIERAGGARLDAQWAEVAASYAIGATFEPPSERCAPTRRSPAIAGAPATPPDEAELELAGTVNDDNALAMEGVAGHAGLFATARDVSAMAAALVTSWCNRTQPWCSRTMPLPARTETVREFWSPAGVPGSSWCLGWDRPTQTPGEVSQAGRLWPRDGVGHLGFTGCSLWIDPARGRWVVLLTNRVFLGDNPQAIKLFRPALHDAIADEGAGASPVSR